MKSPLRFVVIGLGGYAVAHLEAVAWLAEQGLARLAAVVALARDRTKFPERVRALQAQGVALFADLKDFFQHGCEHADLLTVPIGIPQHAPVSLAAMHAGLHVYCEKPLAASMPEVEALIATRDATQRKIAVGFQHIYSHSMQQLKARICAERLGRVREISLLCGWPRSLQYYARNEWAGKLRVGEQWVLDSPANNAHAHYLLNALYLASANEHAAATPHALRAELYRANPIESCDTVQMHFQTNADVSCRVLLTHANRRALGPIMKIVGEKGNAVWEGESGETLINYSDGASEHFNNTANPHWRFEGFRDLVYAIRNDLAPLCSLEIARSHVQTITAMHASCPEIVTIPAAFIDKARVWEMFPPKTKGDFMRVRGLDEALRAAFARGVWLQEAGASWATRG